jgi:hypothetical protein
VGKGLMPPTTGGQASAPRVPGLTTYFTGLRPQRGGGDALKAGEFHCAKSLIVCSSASNHGQIPLTFVANRGQVHRSVRFTATGPELTAYFTAAEVVVNLRGSTVRMRYLGASASPTVEGLELQEGRANYLIGKDQSSWHTNVPLYGGVVYKGLYPGIDMFYSSHMRLLKSEFVVAPGADPSQIRIAYTGVKSLRVDDQGGLIVTSADGDLREDAPEIYQDGSAGPDRVEGAFRVSGNEVTFSVGRYDLNRPLRIDPVLSYSTYLGRGGTTRAQAIALDSTGAAFVTGYTDSTNFPVTGGVVRPTLGRGVEAFVTKLNSSGSAVVYSTYLGGNGDDRGFSIAVDRSGNAYITGWTSSTDFPLASAAQASFGGQRDAFVTKLNSTGTALLYSTYLGGSGTDSGNGIAIDASGSAYVTGSTTSSNFPVLGAFQAALGGQQDGFVTKLNKTGSAIVYSTYLGGALDDRGSSIAVDTSGAAYVAGNTISTNFPTAAALQAVNSGATDAFVTKLSANGHSLVFSTYLGGSETENIEVGRSIVVDSMGCAYITGTTSSTDFPVFLALQGSHARGINDAFAVKLNQEGTSFIYSTYLGGSGIDYGQSIAVDGSGSAYVTGYTSSTDFPSVKADQPANGGGYDVFVAKLDTSGSALLESGFLGGSDSDGGNGIAIDSFGNAYVTGQTLSFDLPVRGAIQTTKGGGSEALAAFVARTKFETALVLSPKSIAFTAIAGTPSSSLENVAITSTDGTAVNFKVTATSSPGGWLVLSANSGTTPLNLDVSANPTGLSVGRYTGSVTITASGTVANSPQSVLVTLNIMSPDRLNVSPSSLTFTQLPNGPTSTSQTVQVTSSGAPIAFLASDWLTVTPSSTTTPATLTVTANGSGLVAGTHTGQLILSSPGVNQQTVDVTLIKSSSSILTIAGSMPQVASAGFWKTTFMLANTGEETALARLSFFDDSGNPLALSLTFPQTSSAAQTPATTVERRIAAGSILIVESTGPDTQPTQVGWAQLLTNGTVGGSAIFRQAVDRTSISEAAVALETRMADAYWLPFDNTGGYATGVAVANIASEAANIGVVIRDDTGAVLTSNKITIPAHGHSSFDMSVRFPGAAQRRGSLELQTPAGGRISVLGLRFSPRTAFTTVPVLAK